MNEDGVFEQKEISFSQRGAKKEFEAAYLCYGPPNDDDLDMSQWTWLK